MKYFCIFILLHSGYISYSQNENTKKDIRYYLRNASNSHLRLYGGRLSVEKFMSESQFDSLIKIANNKNMHVGLSTPRLGVTPQLIMGNDTLTFPFTIPSIWFSKFNELLYTEDKDWLANIFMYKIAKRPGLNLVPYYKNNDYERWKKEWKKEEIKEWEKWISDSKNGSNQELSLKELYEKQYDKLKNGNVPEK
jgi:hypothetical protein